MTEAYKLVSKELEYCSIVRRSYGLQATSPHSIVYTPNERVAAPHGTKLFIFGDLKDALHEAGGDPGEEELWLVDAENITRLGPRVIALPSTQSIYGYWERVREGKPHTFTRTMVAPIGTMWCDALTLLKRVDMVSLKRRLALGHWPANPVDIEDFIL